MITFLKDTGEHVLVLLSTAENGEQEWGCGECGHTRLINFDPDKHLNKVTQLGDFSVKHCMGASCSPELDPGIRLVMTSHNTPVPPPSAYPDVEPYEPTSYTTCGIKWKDKP